MIPPALPWLLAAAGAVATAPAGAPPAGHYAARLCVTVAAQAPNCGPASAELSDEGELHLQVHDIRYVLGFGQGALVGITFHGSMQVAEFVSSYRWAGRTLLFGDAPRGLQYEVELTPAGSAAASASAASR